MTSKEAYIALNLLSGIGPIRLRRLLSVFRSPEAILRASHRELQKVEGIGAETATSIAQWESHTDLTAELKRISDFGAHVITQADSSYPVVLREIYDPPIVLYVWGSFSESDRHAIGIVGTRKPSHYAAECAKKLSYQLAYSGLTVISGLARGVDTAAHQAALAAKGRTIAVLGSGLGHLYPQENQVLAEKIAETGAVITEFPMNFQASRQTFPMRNRIISGCAFGILVVEAGINSGAMITANQALEQGKSLYAIPGRIDQPAALGSNRLLQQGAKLTMCAQDILDDFGLLFVKSPALPQPVRPANLTGDSLSIYEAIGNEEASLDEILLKCRLPTSLVSSTLLNLEMQKLVKQLPGQRFVKIN